MDGFSLGGVRSASGLRIVRPCVSIVGMNKPIHYLLALGLLLLSGCASPPPEQNVAVSPGQQVFLNHCVSCHGGSGSPPGPNALILQSSRLASEADFTAFLRKPSSGMMPPFPQAQLPEAQVHELYVYLKAQAGQ